MKHKINLFFLMLILLVGQVAIFFRFIPKVEALVENVFAVQFGVDDGYQVEGSTTWSLTGTTLRVYSSTTNTPTDSGVLFYNVTIPKGSTIVSANLSLYTVSSLYNDINATVYGHNVDNAPTFGSGELLKDRARTTASTQVYQMDIPGSIWFNITVTSIVQEIVNRAGWQSGNNMSFLLIAAKYDSSAKLMQFSSFESGFKPKLYVTYTVPFGVSNVGASTNLIGSLCNFFSFWSGAELSGGIFSWNASGTWQNDTWIDPWDGTPTSGWFNVTKSLPYKKVTIAYRFYVNTTSDIWGDSGIYTLPLQTVDYSETEVLNLLSLDENMSYPDVWYFSYNASFTRDGWNNITFSTKWGRWIKLDYIKSYETYNYLTAIEMQVQNASGFWFTPTSVYACSDYASPNEPVRFIDGNIKTVWATQLYRTFHWIILDLGGLYAVSGVSVFVNTTAFPYSRFNASVYVGYWSEWYGVGSYPFLNASDYPVNYVWTNNILGTVGNFTFRNTSLSTIENVWVTVNYSISSASGILGVIFWNGSSFVDAGNLTVSTAKTWTVNNISLPRAFWSSIYVNQLKIKFKSYSADTYMIDKVYITVRGWTQLKMLWFLFDTMKMRRVNSTFPLTRTFYEETQTFGGDAVIDMSPILLYKLTGNTSYLEYAKEVADFLATQPICRLFQTFNLASQKWRDQVDPRLAAINLMQLAMLASVDYSYASLLQSAVNNYTAIFFKEPYGRIVLSYVNGSYTDNKDVMIDYTAFASTALTYAGSILNNRTVFDIAYRILINHTRGLKNIPWHGIFLNGTVNPTYNYAKEDQTYGFYLLSLEYFYYQTGNATIKDLIYDVAFASQYFYNSTNKWFNYRVNCDTGGVDWPGPVHGFGLIDEALIQAYLIFGNNSWLEWAKNDFISNAVYHPYDADGYLVKNDLIHHFIGGTDVDDSWNAPAKRVAIIFYNLNVSGFYHNQTWLYTYNKLYGSTSINHKGILGWGNPIDAVSLKFIQGAPDVSLYTIFRNFQNYTDKTINSFTQFYAAFGNWLSGDVFSKPVPNHIGASILNSTHVEFRALWTDFDGLNVAQFYWNVTGTWTLNGTYIFDGNPTEAWSNFTRTYLGEWRPTIYYYIIAIDIFGNIGNTSIQTLTIAMSFSVDFSVSSPSSWNLLLKSAFSVLRSWNLPEAWSILTQNVFNQIASWNLPQAWSILTKISFNIANSLVSTFQWTTEIILTHAVTFAVTLSWILSTSWNILLQSSLNVLNSWNLGNVWTVLSQATYNLAFSLQTSMTYLIEVLKGISISHIIDLIWTTPLNWIIVTTLIAKPPIDYAAIGLGFGIAAFLLAIYTYFRGR